MKTKGIILSLQEEVETKVRHKEIMSSSINKNWTARLNELLWFAIFHASCHTWTLAKMDGWVDGRMDRWTDGVGR